MDWLRAELASRLAARGSRLAARGSRLAARGSRLAARGSHVSHTHCHTLPWPDVDNMIPACFHSNTWRDPSREICTAAPPHREISRPQDRPRTRLQSKAFNLLNHFLHISKQEYCVRQFLKKCIRVSWKEQTERKQQTENNAGDL